MCWGMSVSACGVCLSAGAVADSGVLCAGVCQYQPVECVYQRGRWLTVESCVLGMSVSACGVCLPAGAVADSGVLCAGVCQYQPVECVYQRGRGLTVESCVLGYVSISLWSVSISGGGG